MEKRRPGRPRAQYPYVTKPYKHRAKWRIIIVTGRGPGGRRESYTRSFESNERALAWSREFRRQVSAAGRTVGEAVDTFLEHLRKRKGNKTGSVATSRYRLLAIMDFELAIVDLTARTASAMYDEMVEATDDDGDPKYAPDTHQGSLREAKAFGRFCVSRGWLTSNPFEKVEPAGKKRRRKPQLRIDEARAYFMHCVTYWKTRKDNDPAAARTAACAAMPLVFNIRATETSQLIGRDVDDRGRLLWVAMNEDEKTGEELAKTEASKRAAPVPPFFVPIIRWLAENPALPNGRLFATEDGNPANRHWVRYWAKYHARLAGVPEITVHGLRGTHATLRRAGGESSSAIGEALGQADNGKTADRHYIDPSVAAAADAMQAMDALADGIPSEEIDPEATPKISIGLTSETGELNSDK